MSVSLVEAGISSISPIKHVASSGAIHLRAPANEVVVKPLWSITLDRPKSDNIAVPSSPMRTLNWEYMIIRIRQICRIWKNLTPLRSPWMTPFLCRSWRPSAASITWWSKRSSHSILQHDDLDLQLLDGLLVDSSWGSDIRCHCHTEEISSQEIGQNHHTGPVKEPDFCFYLKGNARLLSHVLNADACKFILQLSAMF
jgi:hypothetical protein